jgi:GDP-L-fucose synthase
MIATENTILITGASGLVATALIEELKNCGYNNLVLCTREDCDLRKFEAVKRVFHQAQPDIVFHTAAAVYGIGGNAIKKGSIFLDNILMNTHVIEAAREVKVKKIIAMGTIAAYADTNAVPIKEEYIWNGSPHSSESSYGHAKRAMLAQLLAYYENYGMDFAYIISTNLYGSNDKFDTQFGHVIPSLVRKCHEAKLNGHKAVIWGDGSATRDFLYSKDMARALVLIMNSFTGAINVASGRKTSIREVADVLTDLYQMQDGIEWDKAKPQGRIFCEMDLSHLRALGFRPLYSMRDGLKETVEWYQLNFDKNLVRL